MQPARTLHSQATEKSVFVLRSNTWNMLSRAVTVRGGSENPITPLPSEGGATWCCLLAVFGPVSSDPVSCSRVWTKEKLPCVPVEGSFCHKAHWYRTQGTEEKGSRAQRQQASYPTFLPPPKQLAEKTLGCEFERQPLLVGWLMHEDTSLGSRETQHFVCASKHLCPRKKPGLASSRNSYNRQRKGTGWGFDGGTLERRPKAWCWAQGDM